MPNIFWETYQRCLAEAVTAKPEEYMLNPGETAAQYAARVAPKMQAAGMAGVNWSSPGFRRTAKALGVKFTRTALVEAATR